MQEVNKSLVDKAQKSEKQHRMENAFSTPLQNRDRLQVITSFLGGASDFIPARECAAIRSAPLPMLRKPRELFEGLFFGEIAFFLTAVTAMIFLFFFPACSWHLALLTFTSLSLANTSFSHCLALQRLPPAPFAQNSFMSSDQVSFFTLGHPSPLHVSIGFFYPVSTQRDGTMTETVPTLCSPSFSSCAVGALVPVGLLLCLHHTPPGEERASSTVRE